LDYVFSKHGQFAVANRASGSLSIIDIATNQLKDTITLPFNQTDNIPEPMYIAYSKPLDVVFVGDRANDRVVVFDPYDYSPITTIATRKGVSHMWAKGKQLWVVNDIDNTLSVINTHYFSLIKTLSIPEDLIALGGRPHDVILDRHSAYVTIIGTSDDAGYVVKYSRRNFKEVARARVGGDPHVILNRKYKPLYVASQDGNAVHILNRSNLNEIKKLDIPGAHGMTISTRNNTLYVTNISGGGASGIFAVELKTNSIIGSVDTPYAVPHSLFVNGEVDKVTTGILCLTHSAHDSGKVTLYKISKQNPLPQLMNEVSVELNPFGLSFVPGINYPKHYGSF